MIKYRDGSPVSLGDVVYWVSTYKWDKHCVRRGTVVKIVERMKPASFVSIMPDKPREGANYKSPVSIYNFNMLLKHSHCGECPNPTPIDTNC